MKLLTKDYRHKTVDTEHAWEMENGKWETSLFKISYRPLIVCLWSIVFGLWSFAAFAANYDIKEMTPAVQQALSSRQARYGQLQSAKQAGAIQENSRGLVSGAEPLASEENRDREVIYQAIAEQNNLGAEGLEQVHRAFAEVHQERG